MTPAPPRLAALDVLRGAALCGILLVNAGPVTGFGSLDPQPATLQDASGWLQLLVAQRFFPVFALLFGAGASLFLASARRRTARPRAALARRLLVLLPVGAVHQLLHPGEALAVYAVLGLVVLLPSTWLPTWAVALGAAVAVPAALALGGGLVLVPGMLLLGSALVRCGVVARLEERSRVPALLCLAFAAASVPLVLQQAGDVAASGFTAVSAVAGLTVAGAWVTGLLTLLQTRARALLVAVFAPLGRTALTCYLSATPVLLLAGAVLDLPGSSSWALLLGVAAGILLVQWAAATRWLRRHEQGPLERLWRWATWGLRPGPRAGGALAPQAAGEAPRGR